MKVAVRGPAHTPGRSGDPVLARCGDAWYKSLVFSVTSIVLPTRFLASVALALAALCVAVLLGAAPASGAAKTTPSYLFVLDGPSATLTPVPGSARAFTLTLKLRSTRQSVHWFTDRPVRDAGSVDMALFVQLWGRNSFMSDPPNVAITYSVGDGTKILIATLTKPVILPKGGTRRTPVLRATLTEVPAAGLKRIARGSGSLVRHAQRALVHVGEAHARVINSRVTMFVDGSTCLSYLECMAAAAALNSYYPVLMSTVYYCLAGGPGQLYQLQDGTQYYICQNDPPPSCSSFIACTAPDGTYPLPMGTVYYCLAGGPGEFYQLRDDTQYYICLNS